MVGDVAFVQPPEVWYLPDVLKISSGKEGQYLLLFSLSLSLSLSLFVFSSTHAYTDTNVCKYDYLFMKT